jgi:hypothetical protein
MDLEAPRLPVCVSGHWLFKIDDVPDFQNHSGISTPAASIDLVGPISALSVVYGGPKCALPVRLFLS